MAPATKAAITQAPSAIPAALAPDMREEWALAVVGCVEVVLDVGMEAWVVIEVVLGSEVFDLGLEDEDEVVERALVLKPLT